jgi:hypothetical protein
MRSQAAEGKLFFDGSEVLPIFNIFLLKREIPVDTLSIKKPWCSEEKFLENNFARRRTVSWRK